MSVSFVLNQEYPLSAFLSQEPEKLPCKGALVRVSGLLGEARYIVVSHFEHETTSVFEIRTRARLQFSKHMIYGLDLSSNTDVQELREKGAAFTGHLQITDESPRRCYHRMKVSREMDGSLPTIIVVAKNYFDPVTIFAAADSR